MSKNLKVILGIVLVCLLVFSLITICIVTKKTADKNINNTNSANSNISSVKDSNTSNTNTNTTNNNTNNTTYQSQEFVRTYTVEKIIHGQEENSYYLTLSIFQGDVDTVLVDLSGYSLKEGKTYEFKFSKDENAVIEDNIKSIFKNCTIKSITKTNKVGLEQEQDAINLPK